MPVYDYKCQCGGRVERFSKIDERGTPQYCLLCGKEMQRVVSAPAVVGDYQGYNCPITGKWIEGKRAHEENLARTGCRVFEPGEKEAVIAKRAEEDRQFTQGVSATIEAQLETMPARKKEKLVEELSSGADLGFARA